jgi:hypothetical protein
MSNTLALVPTRVLLLTFAATLAFAALKPAAASACSCMQQTQEDAAQNAGAIFEGRVTRIENPEGNPTIHFQVVRSFKGPSQESLTASTANSSASCGYGFEQGKSYLVYATQEAGGALAVSLCSRTAPIENATEDLNKLGLGVTPFDPGAGSATTPPPAAPASEPAKGGCASCTIGAGGHGAHEQHAQHGLAALALLVLGACYRITSRRRSGSRS